MTETQNIRHMRPEDVPRVHEIETLCFSSPWSEEAFLAELDGPQETCYLVCLQGEEVAAYGGFWIILDEAHITNVAVHPDFRGRGIGKDLVKALIREGMKMGLKAFTLEVRVSNEPAQRLYQSLGFRAAGRRKNYYVTEDALIMWAFPTMEQMERQE